MDEVFYSCTDLQHSVYLAPSKVRTCCQRFFVKGKQQGDVVLLDAERGDEFSPLNVLNAKLKLVQAINSGEKTDCFGCPYLQKKPWRKLTESTFKVKHISLEYHSICNLKCTYCSDEYYGGESPQYDLSSFISQLKQLGFVEFCDSIVWGGGEPVLDNNFESLVSSVLNDLNPKYLRFFTNAVRHNLLLQDLLNDKRIYITTSIDAGSKETYNKVRGFDRLEKVYSNLEKYAEISPDRVTIKYIFTEGNTSSEEVSLFLGYIQKHGLEKVNFQISFDFTKELVEKNDYLRIIEMYSGLQSLNARSVFLDDLIWQRFSSEDFSRILNQDEFVSHGYSRLIASKEEHQSVVIWGTGSMANFLVAKSHFFSECSPEYFVDGERIFNTEYEIEPITGKRVYPPSKLLDDNSRIVIAAAQQLPVILQSMENLGIHPNRLIREIVL